MTDAEFNEKYPWVNAYEALADALSKVFNGELSEDERNKGDYSKIVTKVKNAFRNAHINYYYDEKKLRDLAKTQEGGKRGNESTEAYKKRIDEKVAQLKQDGATLEKVSNETSKDIDPFSIFGFLNRGGNLNDRRNLAREMMCAFMPNNTFSFESEQFDGIPTSDARNPVFNQDMDKPERNKKLWALFIKVLNWKPQTSSDEDRKKLEDEIREVENINGFTNSRIYLYWVQPHKFLPLDGKSTSYLNFMRFKGITTAALEDASNYLQISKELSNPEAIKWPFNTFIEFSYAAHLFVSSVIGKALRLLDANHNIILHGAPGTGKTFLAKKIIAPMLATPDETHIRFVQFHPGYDYSDFIVGLKPKLVGEEGKEQVAFEWRPGIFKEIAEAAKEALEVEAKEANPNTPFTPSKFVLIIDEINRANLSNVFGEVFSCIEYRFRYQRDENGCLVKDDKGNLVEENNDGVQLPSIKETKADGTEVKQFVREKLVIPENLYIIGTMNDIDRSIESMDFALRRRFAWREITANDSKIIIEEWAAKKGWDSEIEAKLKAAMDALNEYIRGEKELEFGGKDDRKKRKLTLGSEYELGGAYFTKFDWKGDGDEAYEALWENHLKIILNEYLRGEKDKDDILDALYDVYRVAWEVKKPKAK